MGFFGMTVGARSNDGAPGDDRRGAESLELRETPDGVAFAVRVQPRASREEIKGARQGALVVRLTAPPVEGAANRALSRFLGRTLGVAPSAVTIVTGAGGRHKRVVVAGIDAGTLRARLDRPTGR